MKSATALLTVVLLIGGCTRSPSPMEGPPVTEAACEACFPLVANGRVAGIVVARGDLPGVARAAIRVQADLERVAGTRPDVARVDDGQFGATGDGPVIWAGTIGRSHLVDGLIAAGRLDDSSLRGRRETFEWHVVDRPAPGVGQALVIVGSDRRGTIYGLYELSSQAGVSAWEWWADVPVMHRGALYVRPVVHTLGQPAVRYRGIFLNDENPALLGFVNDTFGGFNHRFYERVFELILRLKGNFLWPAMWGKSIYDDDPLSAPLADSMGVVLGTSHHEPMSRAHVEWERYGSGPWDHATNAATLDAFWEEGVRRMGSNESLVTVGMRGDGDEPMTEGTAIALLERIVERQREIIGSVTGAHPSETPQVWALYKEVQEYYDKGMRVPDDVTLLFSDDNWGTIRRLPPAGVEPRAGGYGVYYHFDYVGDPRNYKWLNTNQIQRVQEQMHVAYARGATELWIVNVGDLKPMEFPTSFFLDYAWNPAAWPADRLDEYTRQWAARQFGQEHSADIAGLIDRYSRLAARRKPELIDPSTYSLTRYNEFGRVVGEWRDLAGDAERVGTLLSPEYADAYYQLVLFPVQAMENLHELYFAAALNRQYATQGRRSTNTMADEVARRFAADRELTRRYHEDISGGKWNHMMSQTHIGYTWWQEPPVDVPPVVERIRPPAGAVMGIAVEGSDAAWPGSDAAPEIPILDPYGPDGRWFEVFNRGTEPFRVTIEPGADWLSVEPSVATVEEQERIVLRADWTRAPEGVSRIPLVVSGSTGERMTILASVNNRILTGSGRYRGFVESGGVVAMEAEHYSRAVESAGIRWVTIPGLGKTISGVTPYPVDAAPIESPDGKSPRLEYSFRVDEAGEVDIHALFSPSLDVIGRGGVRYGVSIDEGPVDIVNLHENDTVDAWRTRVANAIHESVTTFMLDTPGEHVVRIWMVDPGPVLQRVVVVTGDVEARALPLGVLGPPESRRFGDVR